MKFLIVVVALLGFLELSSAEETLSEKAQVTTKTATRTVKKAIHRTSEALCGKLTGDSKIECLAKEAKNHLKEGKDVVVDKASEVKNAVDSEKK